MSATSQRNRLLSYLLTHGSITTLQARNELYIMGIAARIWELKNIHNKNIVTRRVPAGSGSSALIADYVLLPGPFHQDKGAV